MEPTTVLYSAINSQDSTDLYITTDNSSGSSVLLDTTFMNYILSTEIPGKSTLSSITKNINYLSYVMVPLLFLTGIIGNILTIVIMMSKSFRKYPVSLVLTVLAISDTIVNLLLPFNRPFVRTFLGFDPRSFSLASCKVFYFAYRVARITSSWMVVIVTTERFVAVWFSSNAKHINTRRNSIILMSSIILLIMSISGYLCSVADQIVKGVCIPNYPVKGKKEVVGVLMVMGFSLYAFIPSSILIIFNILIVIKLVNMRRKLKNASSKGQQQQQQKNDSKDARVIQTTMILLCISISFMVLVNPSALAHLTSYIQKKSIFEAKDTGTVLYREISSVLEQINNSVNFFLYVMGSVKFRRHVFLIFGLNRCFKNRVDTLGGGTIDGKTVASTVNRDAAIF